MKPPQCSFFISPPPVTGVILLTPVTELKGSCTCTSWCLLYVNHLLLVEWCIEHGTQEFKKYKFCVVTLNCIMAVCNLTIITFCNVC